MWAWGANSFGQLGDGTTTGRTSPVQLTSLTNITAIAAGDYHSLALRADGVLMTWGRNSNGQLGDGTTTNRLSPIEVAGLTVTAAGGGTSHTVAVTTSGEAWSWGFNGNGQLGDGTTTQRNVPVQMAGVADAVAVSAGGAFSIILKSDGSVMATGANSTGQLGDGTTTQRTAAVVVQAVPAVTHISAGGSHALARTASGDLWGWGSNGSGQIGDGTTTNRPSAVQLTLSDVSNVRAANSHSLALSTDGVVFAWGANTSSQLGDGTTVRRETPVSLSGPGYTWKVAVPTFNPVGGTYTTTRTVVIATATPGADIHYTTTGVEPTLADPQVASGGSVNVDQNTTLKARAWKTGYPTSDVSSATYTLRPATPTFSPSGGTITSPVSVTIASSTAGSSIRYTTDGSMPTGSSTTYSGPVAVAQTMTLKAIALKDGWDDSAVGTANYTANFGSLAAPVADPVGGTFENQVTVTLTAESGTTIRYTTNGSEPTASSTAYSAPLTFTTTTTLKAKAFHPTNAASATRIETYTIQLAAPTLSRVSGEYPPGELVTITHADPAVTLRITLNGNDPTASDAPVSPGTSLLVGAFTLRARAFKSGATDSAVASATYTLSQPFGPGALALGSLHTVVSSPDGLLYAWGQNIFGQLGDGTTTNRTTPMLVPTVTGVIGLSGGQSHTLAVTNDGRLFAWGSNGSGRLGDGTTVTRTRPVHIDSIADVVRVAAGSSHSLAVTASGDVYAWGAGSSGQLGLGSTTSQSVPTLVTGLSEVVAIAAGGTHSLAVTASGALYAWGANSSGQVGDGTSTTRLTPTLIGTLTDVAQVAAGTSHSIARLQSGAVYTWGLGSSGQLGLGALTNRNVPTLVSGLEAAHVAAGTNHAGAIQTDGTLVTWGANQSGQVGDGTTSTRSSPTPISASVVPVLAGTGGTHAALVTEDGHVWTWGAGSNGQLGDGSTSNRPTPTDVFILDGAWGAGPPPTLSLAPGTYDAPQVVTVSSASPDAVIRYTTNGAVPTEADAVVAVGGQLAIDATTTLRVRSWVPGLPPSPTISATYVLKPATPVVSPTGGSYTSAQTVTLTTTTANTVLRYTLDGSDVTESALEYTGPFSLSTTSTVKTRAFRPGWTSSELGSATLTFQFGELNPLIADPPSGIYPPDQLITLMTPDAGAAIRYTIDGTEPTAGSVLYETPLTLSSGVITLKARAFKDDWTPSPVLSVTYTITDDLTRPTITAVVTPEANANGWHSSEATVTFTCSDEGSGIALCPDPVTVFTSRQGIQVTRTAVDGVGNQTTITVFLDMDVSEPVLTIHTPEAGDTVSAEGGTFTVRGTVADFASGLASVTCNGAAAAIEGQTYGCDVAVAPGSNTVNVSATDYVGHVRTRSVTFSVGALPVTALHLTPASTVMTVNEERELHLVNQRGRLVTDGTWEVDAPQVIELSLEDGRHVARALAAGEATVTVTRGSLTAQAVLNVLPAGSSPQGTLWELGGALAGDTPSRAQALRAIGGSAEGDREPAALFFVDEGTEWSGGQLYRAFEAPTVVRGVSIDGRQVWQHSFTGGIVKQVASDNHGGVLLLIHSEYTGSEPLPQRIRRLSGTTGAVSWEYLSADGDLSEFAVHPDGRVFVTDEPYYDYRINLVSLDGGSGAVLNQWTMPLGSFKRYVNGEPELEGYPTPHATGPIVREDGSVVLVTRRTFGEQFMIRVESSPGNFQLLPDANHESWETGEVQLVQLSPTGSSLQFQNVTLPPDTTGPGLRQVALIPDGAGGYLLAHKQLALVIRITPGNVMTLHEQLLPTGVLSSSVETEYVLAEDAAYAFVKGGVEVRPKRYSFRLTPLLWSPAAPCRAPSERRTCG